jgi:hypothetical protein
VGGAGFGGGVESFVAVVELPPLMWPIQSVSVALSVIVPSPNPVRLTLKVCDPGLQVKVPEAGVPPPLEEAFQLREPPSLQVAVKETLVLLNILMAASPETVIVGLFTSLTKPPLAEFSNALVAASF